MLTKTQINKIAKILDIPFLTCHQEMVWVFEKKRVMNIDIVFKDNKWFVHPVWKYGVKTDAYAEPWPTIEQIAEIHKVIKGE